MVYSQWSNYSKAQKQNRYHQGVCKFCPCTAFNHTIHPGYYSEIRPHQYNGGLAPNVSRRLFWNDTKTVANFSDHIWTPRLLQWLMNMRFASIYPTSS